MAKIVIDARIISTTTGRYVERLLTYLQDIDKDNEFIVLVRKKDVDFWKPTNTNFTVQAAEYKNFSLNEQFGFAFFLYGLKADLVHFCMPQQPILYLKTSITTMHDLILLKTYNSDKNWLVFHLKQLVGRFVFWWLAHKSRFIITPSLFSRREYLMRYHIAESKVKTTYLAAENKKFRPVALQLPYAKFIMYVGQQSDYKNIRRLIKAHQLLLEKYPDLGLVLVGGKSKLHVRNEVWVQENNYKNVSFTGFVNDEQLVWLYQHCAAYVFPSLMEGFGLPGLEAMTEGAPVVSSDATCLPEIYGQAALYFNPLSTEDMSEKIDRVLSDGTLRLELVKKGYERAKRYSWHKMASQTHRVYLDALTRA